MRDLYETAASYAANPSMWQRIKHSKKLAGVRRYQGDLKHGEYGTFGKRVLKGIFTTGATKTFQFIPIPIVKDYTQAIHDKLCKYFKARSHKRKLHQTQYGGDLPTLAKFKLKDLDCGDLDRFRWKITDALKTYQKLFNFAYNNLEDTHAICNDWGKTISKWKYVQHRCARLEGQLAAMEEVIFITREWMHSIDGYVGDSKTQEIDTEYKKIAKAIESEDPEKHLKCSRYLCCHKTAIAGSRTGWGKWLTNKLSWAVNNSIDIASVPDWTDKETYKTNEKGANEGKSSYLFAE